MKLKLLLCLAVLASLPAVPAGAAVNRGGEYFTRANIWYERPDKIPSTNYHVGAILPIGKRVRMIDITRKSFSFQDELGITYTVVYVAKHNGPNMAAYLDFYFSESNILQSEQYLSLSEMEKSNIKAGTLAEGMSKAAVLMAYGIPPSHRTPSTGLNSWIYWINRFINQTVLFDSDGNVTTITR